mgnify:FL=1
MILQRYRRPGLSAARQYFLLRNANPYGGQGRLSRTSLVWVYSGRPTPVGRLYTLELEFRQGEHPSVSVNSPNLLALASGRALPHVYEQDPARLCLFLPWTDEWTPQRTLVETVMPWSLLWLYYFEVWLGTGAWTGGGMHPTEQRPRRKEKYSR